VLGLLNVSCNVDKNRKREGEGKGGKEERFGEQHLRPIMIMLVL